MRGPEVSPAQASRPTELVGRHADRRLIEHCLDRGSGVSACVLVGDAGTGKTALWDWARHRAVRAGATVLASRAGAAEARLPWAGLADLLGGLRPEVIEALPAPQRRAILSGAVAAGVVTVEDGAVRSSHSLLGAAAYTALPAGRRRALHARFARSSNDPAARARHTELAVTS